MSDLVLIYVRDDATGYYAAARGQRISRNPEPRDEAEALLRVMLNGAQMELRDADGAR